MPTATAPAIDLVFSALGDPVRFTMVQHLSSREFATVNDLASLFPISLQAVSKHIKVLEAAGVVTQGRDGRHRPVSLRESAIVSASEWLELRRQQLEARYARLDHVLANLQEGSSK
jgi:DNA-binding transcriptional ArsR family regulator